MVFYYSKFGFEVAAEDFNNGFLIGEMTGDFRPWLTLSGQKMVRTFLQVKRSSGKVDCVPILLNEEVFKLHQDDLKSKTLAYCGHICGQKVEGSDYDIKGAVFHVETIDENIGEYRDNNDITLYGTVVSYPRKKVLPNGNEKYYFALDVYDGQEENRINCFTKDNYLEDVKLLCPGEKIMFDGRIQTRGFERFDKSGSITEVIINRVHSIEYLPQA